MCARCALYNGSHKLYTRVLVVLYVPLLLVYMLIDHGLASSELQAVISKGVVTAPTPSLHHTLYSNYRHTFISLFIAPV